ncbi:uncharacterized protein C1orf198 [Xenopus laevis]|uniref:Uncharacterized protein C1orf198 n=2 Tax=Xenopus laevis TaxID=8355 RepID=A0A1L8ESK3_XENLA|nr:uncharacterized protein C1orf198 [Xenopus laevis]OCT62295.1 hypothetical protein XELAEV_18043379mg [Xenopus laevis]
MASMAAAIAAARTASMSGNRPLDEKERSRFNYFSSLNPMARKIMQEKERLKQRYGSDWDRMEPREQEEAIDRHMVDPQLRARYALHRVTGDSQPLPCYPVLKLHTGQKVVHFGEEDITWQDEHSAPFSWETKSQMDFSIASMSIQDCASTPAQAEQKQTPKPSVPSVQNIKSPLGNQQAKATPAGKTLNSDTSTPVRKEEESAFWKINLERSKIDDSQSEFPSLTPSQIKSLEKGEKPLPSYCRQDSFQKEKEEVKPEKTEKPPVVTKQPKTTNFSLPSFSLESNKAQASRPSVSTLDDVFLPEPAVPPLPAPAPKEPEPEAAVSTEPQLFSQINTSSALLKTGFDFLDNW